MSHYPMFKKPRLGSHMPHSQPSRDMYSLRPKTIDYDKMWGNLEPSIIDIITLQPISNKQWNFMFGDIYEICVAIPDPLGDRLYASVRESLEKHASQLHEKLRETNSGELLPEYYRLWTVYYDGAGFVHMLFRYLNRQYARTRKTCETEQFGNFQMYIHQPEVREIGSLALDIWRQKVMAPLLQSLVSLLLQAIEQDRTGGTPMSDERIVSGVIKSFVQVEESFPSEDRPAVVPTHDFYKDNFECKFLEATRVFYGRLADQLFEKLTCSQYMKTVIDKLDEEDRRTRRFCPLATLPEAMKICQEVMIDAHKERLHSVAPELIEHEMKEDLHNMYRLLRPLQGGLSLLVSEFEAYVRRKGHEAVSGLQGDSVPTQFVERVLAVHEKYSAMKNEVFMGDGDFSGALDKALQAVVNIREEARTVPKASERLARYTDLLLRKSAKGLSESEIENCLTKAIIIFRYIEDKDVFQKYYSKMLSARLIHGLSVSMDAEEMMITKLKNACGYEFTAKLSRMFTDIGLSKELATKFKDYVAVEKVVLGPNMTPFILQAGAWPLSITPTTSAPAQSSSSKDQKEDPATAFILPRELSDCISAFQKFYVQAHNGRKLTWLYHLSMGDVKLGYTDKGYLVTMTVHQMAILFCFETEDTVDTADMQSRTNLTGEVLQKNLKALTESGLLTARSPDMYALNLAVTNKKTKFKVSQPQMQKAAEKESEHVNTTIQQDRKYYMECAIVRIMKMRKVLKHNVLVQEVIEQTRARFAPDLPFIKKSIEDLIEKLYLQRTDSHDEYQYLA